MEKVHVYGKAVDLVKDNSPILVYTNNKWEVVSKGLPNTAFKVFNIFEAKTFITEQQNIDRILFEYWVEPITRNSNDNTH